MTLVHFVSVDKEIVSVLIRGDSLSVAWLGRFSLEWCREFLDHSEVLS